MSQLIYTAIVSFVLAFAVTKAMADEPTAAELKAQLDRIEQTQRAEASKARRRAFQQRHRDMARSHHRRGLGQCTANC